MDSLVIPAFAGAGAVVLLLAIVGWFRPRAMLVLGGALTLLGAALVLAAHLDPSDSRPFGVVAESTLQSILGGALLALGAPTTLTSLLRLLIRRLSRPPSIAT